MCIDYGALLITFAETEKATDVAEEILANLDADEIQVGSLVEEFLAAQSLKILPQAPFGDAVTQFVTKDDKHAMEHFVSESLSGQVRQMLSLEDDEEDLESAMTLFKQKLEQQFKVGSIKQSKMRRYKPQPDGWDSDLDGHWQDQPEAIDTAAPAVSTPAAVSKAAITAYKPSARARKATGVVDDDGEEMDDAVPVPPAPRTRARAPAAKKAPAKPKAPAKKPAAKGRGKNAQVFDQSDEEEGDDVFMDDDDDDPPAPPPKRAAATRASTARSQPSRAAAAAPASKNRQSKLNFSSQQKATQQEPMEISDDAISDDPFESMPSTRSRGR